MGEYEWSEYSLRYFLNGKEIFVEKHIVRRLDEKKEIIHELETRDYNGSL